MRQRVSAEQKQKVKQRAGRRCEYCFSPEWFATQPFSVEHIYPRQKGGDNLLENLAFACQGCNNYKHIRVTGLDPVTERRVPLYHPRRQVWSDHFAWSEDFGLILGLTPAGRATVEVLRLNREGLINLRSALIAIGQHPPEGQE